MRLQHCHVGIIGLGLIGSSIASALTGGRGCRSVRGWDMDRLVTEEALRRGFITEPAPGLEDLASSSDVLVVAVPPVAILDVGRKAFDTSGGVVRVVMDTGSAKRMVAEGMRALWKSRYVGFHPMAGKENGGVENADPGLFTGSVSALVKTPETSPEALSIAREMAEAIGSGHVEMDPETHDRSVACVSHLPVFLSMALSLAAGECSRRLPELQNLAAGGFRDTSRVASGPPWLVAEMWEQNGDLIAPLLQDVIRLLETMVSSSKEQLAGLSEQAGFARKSILEKALSGGGLS